MLVTGCCCWCPGRPAGEAVNACSAHKPPGADGQSLQAQICISGQTMWNIPVMMVVSKLYSCVCVTYKDGMQ